MAWNWLLRRWVIKDPDTMAGADILQFPQSAAVNSLPLLDLAAHRAVDLDRLRTGGGFAAIAWFGDAEGLRQVRLALSEREGALLPLLTGPADVGRLQLERHVCIDTTAAGGNASLMAAAL